MARTKDWIFTLNHPEEPLDLQPCIDDGTLIYATYQLEVGSNNGQLHYQGYIEGARRFRLTQVRNLAPGLRRAHFEPRRGSRQEAKEYCEKEESRCTSAILECLNLTSWNIRTEVGTWRTCSQGARNDLLSIKTDLDAGVDEKTIADNHFNQWVRYHKAFREYKRIKCPNRAWQTETHVLYGPTGTGKSKWAVEQFPGAYWKQRSQWWDGYDGQSVVVLDEFYGWIPFDLLLRLADRYPLLVETKGGQTTFLANKIIITTNKLPAQWYKDNYFEALKRRVTKWHYLPELGVHTEHDDYADAYTGGWAIQ